MATTIGSIRTRYPFLDIGKECIVIGKFTFSGNYTTGGLDLTATWKTADVKSSSKPHEVSCHGLDIYLYQYDYTNNKLLIRDTSASGAEISAAALPAGVTGDTVSFVAYFDKEL